MDIEEILIKLLEINKNIMGYIDALADGRTIDTDAFSKNAKMIQKLTTDIKKAYNRR